MFTIGVINCRRIFIFDLHYELDPSIQPVNIKTIGYSLKAKTKKFVYLLPKNQLVHPHKTPTPTPTLLRKKRDRLRLINLEIG